MKVLWLASWFPNRTSPFNGDFIERHALATAAFVDQLFVMAVVKDDAMEKGTTEIIKKQTGNLTVYTAYYGRGRFGLAEKLLSFRKYFSLQKKIYQLIESEFGSPDLAHVHVPMKAGLFAQYLERKYNIPYVVTEHWAGYNRLCRPGIFDLGKTFIKLNNLVLKNARLVLPVSDDLGKMINDNFTKINYRVVPNVVDTTIFFPADKKENQVLQLIHVSTMGYQKNMEALVNALLLWKQKGGRFELNCYGPVNKKLVKLVQEQSLDRQIFFHGELAQPLIAKAMQQSDVLILYSRYETFGCVLIEANACGIPVIVSDLPVFHELVQQDVNAVFAEGDNPPALAEALAGFAACKDKFNKSMIAEAARQRFSYQTVGEQIRDVYVEILKNRLS
jgi:glycosyltransferase involved in cell wall biosynthesis